MYSLINTETNEVVKTDINLTEKEKNVFNIAFATNHSPLRYVKISSKKTLTNEVNLFTFSQPI